MKIFLFLIFIFVLACSTPSVNSRIIKFNDFDRISFEKFKLKLNEYANKSSYPQIDN